MNRADRADESAVMNYGHLDTQTPPVSKAHCLLLVGSVAAALLFSAVLPAEAHALSATTHHVHHGIFEPLTAILRFFAGTAPRTDYRTDLTRARQALSEQITAHPILKGTTVVLGDAKGHQAIAYYETGHIVIDTAHSVQVETLIAHEVWHVIDWRDNQTIDWGENVPPRRPSP